MGGGGEGEPSRGGISKNRAYESLVEKGERFFGWAPRGRSDRAEGSKAMEELFPQRVSMELEGQGAIESDAKEGGGGVEA